MKGLADERIEEKFRQHRLDRELERIRGAERQELRFESYGKLWNEMRPLAIYDEARFDQAMAKKMSRRLSSWYFSDSGGLMLTSHNRDLYRLLQEVLREAARHKGWKGQRVPEPEAVFEELMEGRGHSEALGLLEYLDNEATLPAWPVSSSAITLNGGARGIPKVAGRRTGLSGIEQWRRSPRRAG